jgi:hypothetical protein
MRQISKPVARIGIYPRIESDCGGTAWQKNLICWLYFIAGVGAPLVHRKV